MQASPGSNTLKKPKKRPARSIIDTIAEKGDSQCEESASKIQGQWRKKQAEKHVQNVRMIYAQVRMAAQERGVVGEDGEVLDSKTWCSLRNQVCQDVLAATKKTIMVGKIIDVMKESATSTARLRRLKQGIKVQYMAVAMKDQVETSKRINEEEWRHLFTVADEAIKDDDDIEAVLDDQKIIQSDQAARRIQQAWTVNRLQKEERQQKDEVASPNQEMPAAEPAAKGEGAETSEDQVSTWDSKIAMLRTRAERLARLRDSDRAAGRAAERALLAAAEHVQKMNVGTAKKLSPTEASGMSGTTQPTELSSPHTDAGLTVVGKQHGVQEEKLFESPQADAPQSPQVDAPQSLQAEVRRGSLEDSRKSLTAEPNRPNLQALYDRASDVSLNPQPPPDGSATIACAPEARPEVVLPPAEDPMESAKVAESSPSSSQPTSPLSHAQPPGHATHRGHLARGGRLAPLGRPADVGGFCVVGGSSASNATAAPAAPPGGPPHKVPLIQGPGFQKNGTSLGAPSSFSARTAPRNTGHPIEASSLSGPASVRSISGQDYPPAPISPNLAPRAPAAPPPTNAGTVARSRLAAAPAAAAIAPPGPQLSVNVTNTRHAEAPRKLPANGPRKPAPLRSGPAGNGTRVSHGGPNGTARAAVAEVNLGGSPIAITSASRPEKLPPIPALA